MNLIIKWLLYSLAIIFIAWLIPGISIANFLSAMIVCIIIALINTFVKPILQLISFQINVLTLGLFSLVLNALLFMLVGVISPGFNVSRFWSAFLGSIVLSILSIGISLFDKN